MDNLGISGYNEMVYMPIYKPHIHAKYIQYNSEDQYMHISTGRFTDGFGYLWGPCPVGKSPGMGLGKEDHDEWAMIMGCCTRCTRMRAAPQGCPRYAPHPYPI
jgi:hypothetical protein